MMKAGAGSSKILLSAFRVKDAVESPDGTERKGTSFPTKAKQVSPLHMISRFADDQAPLEMTRVRERHNAVEYSTASKTWGLTL